jgi:hypothetical protein
MPLIQHKQRERKKRSNTIHLLSDLESHLTKCQLSAFVVQAVLEDSQETRDLAGTQLCGKCAIAKQTKQTKTKGKER